MFSRKLIETLRKDLQTAPAVVLYGPRQVGKTTVVKQLAQADKERYIYLDMELPSDRIKLSDPELFLTRLEDKTVILDEVQFVPNLFPVLRALIDQNRQPGRFLLLGSASPALLQQSSESLAGRVRYREMFPLSLAEVEAEHVNQLWFRGGFPVAYLANSDAEAMHWQADFVRSYTTRDMALLGLPMPPTQIERLLQMLAHTHGQLLNASNLARSLGVSAPTVTNALYYLEEAMLIRTLKPWHANTTKRLVKSPKVYIRDNGMLHHLLATGSLNQLFGHPQAGNSWEGFVIQQLLATLPPGLQPYFYRTAAGAELDLLLVGSNKVEWAIEIKMSGTPQLTRGNTEAHLDLQPAQNAIITPMSGSYPFRDKWMVYGVGDILEEVNHHQ